MNKENRATGIFNYIHSDVWGPTPTRSHGSARYLHFHGWLFTNDLGLLHMGEIWNLCEVQKMESRSREQGARSSTCVVTMEVNIATESSWSFASNKALLVTSPWRRLRSRMAQRKGWTELSWREMHETSCGVTRIFLGLSLLTMLPSWLIDHHQSCSIPDVLKKFGQVRTSIILL